MGSLKMTRWLYPSHCRLDLIQLLQIGLLSSHFIRRLRQASNLGSDICVPTAEEGMDAEATY